MNSSKKWQMAADHATQLEYEPGSAAWWAEVRNMLRLLSGMGYGERK